MRSSYKNIYENLKLVLTALRYKKDIYLRPLLIFLFLCTYKSCTVCPVNFPNFFQFLLEIKSLAHSAIDDYAKDGGLEKV